MQNSVIECLYNTELHKTVCHQYFSLNTFAPEKKIA